MEPWNAGKHKRVWDTKNDTGPETLENKGKIPPLEKQENIEKTPETFW